MLFIKSPSDPAYVFRYPDASEVGVQSSPHGRHIRRFDDYPHGRIVPGHVDTGAREFPSGLGSESGKDGSRIGRFYLEDRFQHDCSVGFEDLLDVGPFLVEDLGSAPFALKVLRVPDGLIAF